MPGEPKLRKFEAHLEKLGGEDVLFDLLATEPRVENVAEHFQGFLPGHPDFPSRSWLYRWRKAGGEERIKKWHQAMKLRSHLLVEDALSLLESEETNPATSAEAQLLKMRVGHRKYLAEKYNRKDFGEEKDETNVNLSVGSLHLDALRSAGSMEQVERPAEREMLEAEVVDEE